MNKRRLKKKKKFAQAMLAATIGDQIDYRMHLKGFTERMFTGPPATRPGYVLLTDRLMKRKMTKLVKRIRFPKKYKWLGSISGPMHERLIQKQRKS